MAEFQRSLAIIIGINNYQHGIKSLETAKYDAEELAKILSDKNRQDSYEVTLITDDTNIKPTRENILNFLTKTLIEKKLTQSDRLLFYFAGHGIARTNENDQEYEGPQGFLVPSDAHYNELDSLIPMREVYQSLAKLKCRHLLVILDCCFAGAFRWASTFRSHYTPRKITKAHYQRFTKFHAWQVITSSAYNQEALDFVDNRGKDKTDDKHSPFAQALFQGLKGEADLDNDGVIVAPELYLYTRKYVEENSQEKQTPGFFPLQRHDRGEYIFRIPNRELNLAETPLLNPDNNPYRGLEPFEEKHSRFFFGRQKLITELAQRLNQEDHRLTVVLGASGSGKSSLVKAGLIPHLHQEEEHQWKIIASMRPGEYPFTALARSIYSISGYLSISEETSLDFIDESLTNYLSQNDKKKTNDEDRIKTLQKNWSDSSFSEKLLLINNRFSDFKKVCQNEQEEAQLTDLRQRIQQSLQQYIDDLRNNSQKLIDIINNWTQTYPQTQLLLVIDQFEELITLTRQTDTETNSESKKTWESFLKLLAKTLNTCPQFHLVVTLRSDFETRFLDSALKAYWAEARFSVRPMSSSELRESIERPALERALYFNPANLVDRLIDEVGQMPGALPLLSFTLSELYLKLAKKWQTQETDDRALTIDEKFESQGGVAGALTNRANKEYDDLRDENLQITMRRLMLRMLIVEGWEVARRQVSDSELLYPEEEENERVREVIDRLVNARLVVRGQGIEEAYVEPAHDYLVRGWNKLQDWIKEEQENLTLQQRLIPTVNDWKKNNKVKGLLLPDGERLNQLEKILAQEHNWFNQQETSFLQASIYNRELQQRQTREQQTKIKLLQKADQIENLLIVQPLDALILSIQAIGENLEQLPQKILAPVQTSLQIAMDKGKIPINLQRDEDYSGSSVPIAYSFDGYWIVGGDKNGTLRLWNNQGQLLREFNSKHQGQVSVVTFSPDNKRFISGGEDGKVKLWDIEGNLIDESICSFCHHIYSITFSSHGIRIIGFVSNDIVKIWDFNGNVIWNFNDKFPDKMGLLCFSSDGQNIIRILPDGRVKIWDFQGKLIQEFTLKLEEEVSFKLIAISPDNQILVSLHERWPQDMIQLWDMSGNILPHPDEAFEFNLDSRDFKDKNINSVVFSPDGQRLVTGGWDGIVRFWDLEGNLLKELISEDRESIFSIIFNPNGENLVCVSEYGTVQLWDLRDSFIKTLGKHNDSVYSVAFSPNGQKIVSGGGSDDGSLKVWNLKNQKDILIFRKEGRSIHSVIFSPDGEKIAGGTANGDDWSFKRNWQGLRVVQVYHKYNTLSPSKAEGTKLWNLQGKLISHLVQKDKYDVYTVAFSPNGKLIISGCGDGTLRLWNIDNQQNNKRWQGHDGVISSVAFSPDGQKIASSGEDGIIKLWDLQGRQISELFRGDQYDSNSIAFSPDGQKIVSGDQYGIIRLWNLKSQRIEQSFRGHETLVNSIAFSPDGQVIISCGYDETIKLWNLQGNPIGEPLKTDADSINSVAFSPDGNMIVSGDWNMSSMDGSVKLWRGSWCSWLELCCDRLCDHPVFKNPVTEEEKQACQTCHDYVWHPEIGAEKLFQKGKKRFEEESYEKALSIFNLVIQLNSNHTNAYHYRDKCWQQLNF